MNKKKFTVPTFVGIASVWFGTHLGPGVASGKQVSSYFAETGKLGIFTPFIGMAFLGLAIYFAIEYSRRNDIRDFNTFSNRFFHPHEKLFSVFFEVTFVVTCILVPGLCIATSAKLLQQNFGLPLWIGSLFMAVGTILLAMYGADLVKNASTILTVGMIAIVVFLVVLGVEESAGTIQENWSNTSISDISIWGAIGSSFIYAGFQATGNITNAIAVTKGLKNKRDSQKAALLGIFMNALVLMLLALMQYGFQPESYNSEIPNYYIVLQLGIPALKVVYVLLVLFASFSTLISFAFSATTRYEKYVKMKNEKKRNLIIILGMLVFNLLISSLGITTIVNIGFRYLGYLSLPFVLIPVVIVGMKKVSFSKLTNS